MAIRLSGSFAVTNGTVQRDFGQFSEALGEHFCTQLSQSYLTFWRLNDQTELTYWQNIGRLLKYTAESPSQQGLRNFLKFGAISGQGSSAIEVLFHNWLSGYRQNLKDSSLSNRSKNNQTAGVRAFVSHLADQGVIPQGLSIKGFKFNPEVGVSLLGVNINKSVDLERLLEDLCEKKQSNGWEITSDTIPLIHNLLIDADKTADFNYDLVEGAIQLLSRRREALRLRCAQHIVRHISLLSMADQWSTDPKLLEAAAELKWLFDDRDMSAKLKGKAYRILLENNSLSIMTVFCQQYCDGIFPMDGATYNTQLMIRLKHFGIKPSSIREALGITNRSITAAHVWLSFEFAINSDSVLKIPFDCLKPSGEEGVKVLSWFKPRKGESNFESEIVIERDEQAQLTASSLTGIDVIEFVRKATSAIRPIAYEKDRNNLFLNFYKNFKKKDVFSRVYVPSTPSGRTLNTHFKEICLDVSGGRWTSTLKALRASELILCALVTRDLFEVKKKGRHDSLYMAKHYVSHLPEILRREKNIRDFLAWFETLLTVNINQFAEKVGLDVDAYELRKKKLINQQFGGIHCEDPMQGIQPGTVPGEVCHRVDKCVSCKNRRSLFLLTSENLVNVLHWNVVLQRMRGLLGDKEFSVTWRTWMLFTESIIEMVRSNTEHRRLFEGAQEMVRMQKNPYLNLFPELNGVR